MIELTAAENLVLALHAIDHALVHRRRADEHGKISVQMAHLTAACRWADISKEYADRAHCQAIVGDVDDAPPAV